MQRHYALLLALALPLCLPQPAAAQFEDIPAAMAGDLRETDRKDYFWKREELDFGNDPYTAVCLNGRYVHSLRGFNQEIMSDLYGCGHNRVSPRETWAELADSTARVAGETVYYFGACLSELWRTTPARNTAPKCSRSPASGGNTPPPAQTGGRAFSSSTTT